MQSVHIVTVGKLKEKFYIQACEEYVKRLGAYCKLSQTVIGEEKLSGNPSDMEIEKALDREAEKILGKIPENATIVAMCVEGKGYSSPQLAEWIAHCQHSEQRHLVFVIGGSFGLSQRVKERAKVKLSMSEMTFPHHLAQVMLLEQVYRGFKILEGGAYHK